MYRLILLLAILGCSSLAVSAEALSDTAKALYQSRCAACHQVAGEGSEALKAPNISGLSEAYIARQLQHFQSGLRGADQADSAGQMMAAAVVGLSSTDLDALASYVADLNDVRLFSERQATGFRGRGLYSVCSSCHGAQGEGNIALGAPRLNQQHSWYLVTQLENYKQGIRGAKSNDEYGQQMRAMAESVHEDDVELLVRHISGLGLQP